MLFNSLAFAVFLPIIFVLYWMLANRSITLRNVLLLAASYVFYGFWDVRFLLLIIISSAVDYSVGLLLHSSDNPATRKKYLAVSLFVNIGILFIFKYFDFFANEFSQLLAQMDIIASPLSLEIIIPVGISFYTFQTLSYTIDIYYKRLEPSRDLIAFFAFVAFFPQLVAGPIERASRLLPQFAQQHIFKRSQAIEGLQLILWGLFKKVVIADRLAQYTDPVFANVEAYEGLTFILATLGFAIRIYADFSGYSSIAIGTAKLFGFELMTNFRTPYVARSLQEFWSRWHISLSTWFRDYVYIPLGGNQVSESRWIINILLTFAISGLWHGDKWTFLIWGLIHGVSYAVEGFNRKHQYISLPWKALTARFLTLLVVGIGWIFFRAETLSDALYIVQNLFTNFREQLSNGQLFIESILGGFTTVGPGWYLLGSLGIFILIEHFLARMSIHILFARIPKALRWAIYYGLIAWFLLFGAYQETQSFIYFQF